jgi:DNA-binding SARP family transcriptional activator
VLGASVIGVLERMRRAQQRRRSTGLRIALPEQELAHLERGLRVGADDEAVEWIDLAQRLLATRARSIFQLHATPSFGLPRTIAVRLCPDVVELLLDQEREAEPAFEPFEATPDGRRWLLPKRPEILEELRRDVSVIDSDPAIPSLVTLGRDSRGLVLLDMERVGSIEISGTESDKLAEAMAVEMASSRWSDQIDLVLVGMGLGATSLERVSRASSVASIVQRLERRVKERKALLDIARHATNEESRWLEGGDAWDLCVVFCTKTAVDAEADAVQELIDLAADGSYGLAVVVSNAYPALVRVRARVNADGAPLNFRADQLGLMEEIDPPLWAQQVDSGFARNVSALVNVAEDVGGILPDDEFAGTMLTSRPDNVRDHEDGEVEVRVLGPLEVVGAARPFTRAWALELVVYLAFHRQAGASTDQWSTALWPERIMAPASLHSTASAARRALGTSQTGEDHLPRSHGRLALGPGVTTDWERFARLSRSVEADDWRMALESIRGRPFDGLRASDWTLLEGISAMIESEVVDLSCRFAERSLGQSDWANAEWAARQALRVSPYDERLYRVLMRSADQAGNPAGVESVMRELVHLVAEDVEPFDAVHPETFRLYRELSRRSLSSRLR